MSKIKNYLLEQQEIEDLPPAPAYPDFNEWVEELERNPKYIADTEKRLDNELGKDRLI